MNYAGMCDNVAGRGDYYRGDYYRGDYYRGDFLGLGHFLSGAVSTVVKGVGGFVTGGPMGAVAAVAGSILKRPSQAPAVISPTGVSPGLGPATPGYTQLQIPSISGSAGGIAGQYGLINIQDVQAKQAGTAMVVGPGGQLVPCQIKGTHLNKTGYYTKHGYVPKHSVCVRNRRMNPANGHALRRALRRVGSFGRIVKRMKKAIGRANSAVGNVHHARKRAFGRK